MDLDNLRITFLAKNVHFKESKFRSLKFTESTLIAKVAGPLPSRVT